MQYSEQEQAWIELAKRQQKEFWRRQEEQAELKKLRSEAAIGVELAKKIAARGGVTIGLRPDELLPASDSDADLRRQADLGREMGRQINLRLTGSE